MSEESSSRQLRAGQSCRILHTIATDRGDDAAVTYHPGPADDCEWTPDGAWIVFNTEQFSTRAGHAQLARVRPDGSDLQQRTFDDRVNWFGHIAPSGDVAAYLSYPPGTTGHPADLQVQLRLVDLNAWQQPTTLLELTGCQGTINVPSRAPDGSAFAFIDDPLGGAGTAVSG